MRIALVDMTRLPVSSSGYAQVLSSLTGISMLAWGGVFAVAIAVFCLRAPHSGPSPRRFGALWWVLPLRRALAFPLGLPMSPLKPGGWRTHFLCPDRGKPDLLDDIHCRLHDICNGIRDRCRCRGVCWQPDQGHFRWEACEDPRELKRQLVGALLMGCGAALAVGCTVGQGLSAIATLSLGAPLAMAGIFIGARFGLRQLIEGLASP